VRVNLDGSAGLIGNCHSGTANGKCSNFQNHFCFEHPFSHPFPESRKGKNKGD
jgi:hypothetical protein